jgi:four helix bundle protein
LTDSDGENAETETWLDFAKDCSYINEKDYDKFLVECRGVGSMLGAVIKNPNSI